MGHPGAVRRLLRRQGQGLLQGGGTRRHDQAGRPRRRARAGDRRRRRRRRRRLDAGGARRPREGRALVNIAQPFKHSGMELTCRADRHQDAGGFKGQKIGVWFGGNEYPFLAWMGKLGFKTDGAPAASRWSSRASMSIRCSKQADCISTKTYNEYWQVSTPATSPSSSSSSYEDQGRDARGRSLRDRGQAQGPGVRRQAGALRQGVDEGLGYAREQLDEAVKIVLDNDAPAPRPSTTRSR